MAGNDDEEQCTKSVRLKLRAHTSPYGAEGITDLFTQIWLRAKQSSRERGRRRRSSSMTRRPPFSRSRRNCPVLIDADQHHGAQISA